MNNTANTVKSASVMVKLAVGLAALATTISPTAAGAQTPVGNERGNTTITLRVYDYAHLKQKKLQAAEEEAARILAKAGVLLHWVECPTQHQDGEQYNACTGATQGTNYTLRLLSSSMAAVEAKTQQSLGSVTDCVQGTCIASVYYDRIDDISGGDRAPSYVLTGRVMAREIGQLLIGVAYQSQSGIMSASWTYRQLGMADSAKLVFSSSEASAMRARLAERELAAATNLAKESNGQLSQNQ